MKIVVHDPIEMLVVHHLHDTKWWLVMHDFTIRMSIDGIIHTMIVPAGYRYDRATIWWQVWINKEQLGSVGPLVHDVLCQYKGKLPPIVHDEVPAMNPSHTFTRPEVDDIFRAVMLADHVDAWRAWVAWVVVKLVPNWKV